MVDQHRVGGGSASAAVRQVTSWPAQGQVAGMRIVRLRWPRMMRAAVFSSRYRRVLGSALVRGPSRHSSRNQHSRSQAIAAAMHQAWLMSKEAEG